MIHPSSREGNLYPVLFQMDTQVRLTFPEDKGYCSASCARSSLLWLDFMRYSKRNGMGSESFHGEKETRFNSIMESLDLLV